MIFADRISQLTRHDGLLNKLLDGSRMVAIHDDVVAEAMRLVKASDEKKMREVSKYTCWPDYDTWLECVIDDADVGVYFHGEGRSVTQGYAMIIIDFRREDDDLDFIPIALNLETYDVKFCDLQKVARMRAERMGIDNEIRAMFQLIEPSSSVSTDSLVQHAVMQPFMTWFKPLLLALLAFMNSPKLIRKREVDVTRLNARRIKRGKYPFHPHHQIRLNIDKHDLKITPGLGDGPERAQHFVRAHLRFLVHPRYKNVSVVLVPPHYRGNPELGMRNTSYAVDRQHSRWME